MYNSSEFAIKIKNINCSAQTEVMIEKAKCNYIHWNSIYIMHFTKTVPRKGLATQ